MIGLVGKRHVLLNNSLPHLAYRLRDPLIYIKIVWAPSTYY